LAIIFPPSGGRDHHFIGQQNATGSGQMAKRRSLHKTKPKQNKEQNKKQKVYK